LKGKGTQKKKHTNLRGKKNKVEGLTVILEILTKMIALWMGGTELKNTI
jgi:hypothetical protein